MMLSKTLSNTQGRSTEGRSDVGGVAGVGAAHPCAPEIAPVVDSKVLVMGLSTMQT